MTMQTPFNRAYLDARKAVKVKRTPRGWHAAHRALRIAREGRTREIALQRCALAVASTQTQH
jgi:hypothetical protein